ncbi:glycoside hydrolase family 32 protein [Gemmiger sp.]
MNVLTTVLQQYLSSCEKTQEAHENDKWRLRLHLMPPTGFMNDPNGLCWFKGLWHVFFQYAPSSPEGGLKYWGHYTSPDMLHWTYWGTPLIPDQPFDCHGEYSGSAIVKDDVLHVFCSGNLFLQGNPPRAFSVIHVTSKDGFHFSEKKVVISSEDYPQACSCQIRDPKVWKDGSEYRMVLGAQTINETGAVLIYHSADLDHWDFERMMVPGKDFGYMWECPDVFKINDSNYLSLSPQGIPSEEFRYANVFQSVWTNMRDEPNFTYTEWDKGFDFYAPQTFAAPDGRRILYGWMGMDALAGYSNPTIKYGWQHAQTLPRAITEKNGILYQMPVKEIEQLRMSSFSVEESAKLLLPCELALQNPDNSSFDLMLGTGLHFAFEQNDSVLRLYFTDETGSGRTERKAKVKEVKNVRLWIDTSSVEIFVNDGAVVFSTRFYPDSDKIELYVRADHPCAITGWNLKPITMERGQIYV